VVHSSTAPVEAGACCAAEQLAGHEGLVRWVVRQQWLGELSFADALHEGRLGLWRALVRYDPGRGTCFSTYAVPAIPRAVWAAVTRARVGAVPTGGASRRPVELVDPAGAAVERIERAQVQGAVRALVGQLAPPLQQVVVWHAGLDGQPARTFAAIGERLGVSRQRAHQLHRAALVGLAQPARSAELRRLVGRTLRADYQQALARGRQVARARRGRQGRRR